MEPSNSWTLISPASAVELHCLRCQALCRTEAEKLPCQLGGQPSDRVEISSLGRLSMRAFHSVFAGICRRVPSKLPVSMTTLPFSLPTIHLRVLAAEGERPPGGLKMPLARSAPAGGRWPKHHVHLEEAAPSFTGEGEAEQNHPRASQASQLVFLLFRWRSAGKSAKQTLTCEHLQNVQMGFFF